MRQQSRTLMFSIDEKVSFWREDTAFCMGGSTKTAHLPASTSQKVPIRRECDTVQGGVQGEVVPATRHPVQQNTSLYLDINEC